MNNIFENLRFSSDRPNCVRLDSAVMDFKDGRGAIADLATNGFVLGDETDRFVQESLLSDTLFSFDVTISQIGDEDDRTWKTFSDALCDYITAHPTLSLCRRNYFDECIMEIYGEVVNNGNPFLLRSEHSYSFDFMNWCIFCDAKGSQKVIQTFLDTYLDQILVKTTGEND